MTLKTKEHAMNEGIVPCGGRPDEQGYNPIIGPYRDAWCALPLDHDSAHDYRHPNGSAVSEQWVHPPLSPPELRIDP